MLGNLRDRKMSARSGVLCPTQSAYRSIYGELQFNSLIDGTDTANDVCACSCICDCACECVGRRCVCTLTEHSSRSLVKLAKLWTA